MTGVKDSELCLQGTPTWGALSLNEGSQRFTKQGRFLRYASQPLPRIPFASATTDCHPEEAEPGFAEDPDEGPMHLSRSSDAAGESIGPSARKERGPQDDKCVKGQVLLADRTSLTSSLRLLVSRPHASR